MSKLQDRDNIEQVIKLVHDKLFIGMTIKSFKELCNLLECPIAKGNTNGRKFRQALFERCFMYHTDGQKIIIDDIYDEPLPDFDVKGICNIFQRLFMMWAISTDKVDKCFLITDFQLIQELEIINEQYFNQRRIFKMLERDDEKCKDYIEWFNFFSRCDRYLKNELIGRMLLSMEKRYLIASANKCYVCNNIELNHVEERIWVNILNTTAKQSFYNIPVFQCLTNPQYNKRYFKEIEERWFKCQNIHTSVPYKCWKINLSKLCAEIALTSKEKEKNEIEINLQIVERLKNCKNFKEQVIYIDKIDEYIKIKSDTK